MILPFTSYNFFNKFNSYNEYEKPDKPKNYQISRKGKLLIKKFEGFRSEPYLDAVGVPTIGIGFTHYPDGTPVELYDDAITKEEALQILDELLDKYEAAVNEFVTSEITQNQFDALVSFTYNLGIGALKSSTLLKKINANPNDEIIPYEFKRWVYADGKKLKGLVRRRTQEAKLYES